MGLFSGGGFFSPGHGLFGSDSERDYGTNRSPNPFPSGQLDPKTAYKVRLKAGRIIAPAMAALQAGNYLLDPSVDFSRRAGRAGAGLFGEIAPEYLDAYRGADPETSGLLHLLNQDATSLVNRGSADPYEDRGLQEDIRGSQASRGLAFGRGGALEELINLDRARDIRRIQRGQYGAGITNLGREYYGPALTGLLAGYAPSSQATGLDDLLSLSVNDTASRRNQHAARVAGNQALWGSVIQSVGSIAGGAAAACWVAEELYGVNDERTHLARAWVLAHPDDPFVRRYQKHGKRWAKWLKANQWARLIFQPIWDSMWIKQQWQELRTFNVQRSTLNVGSSAT